MNPIDKVSEIYGSKAKLARSLGITKGAVSQWDVIPTKYIASIAEHTGMSVKELRPDLYPKDKNDKARKTDR